VNWDDIDWDGMNFDPVLVSIAVVFAVCAIYLLFLRNSIMWGFLCILGIVAVAVAVVYPEVINQ
jgi:hypothetical protein